MANKRMRSACAAVVIVSAGLAACSSSSGGPPAMGDNSGIMADDSTNSSVCPTWTSTLQPLQAYQPAMAQMGENGVFRFTIVNVDPAPPALGNTGWKVQVTDANGQPVTGATLAAPPGFMPQHNHPSTATPSVTSNNDGSFDVANEYFFMPGVWQIKFTATSGATTDTTVFTFCLGM